MPHIAAARMLAGDLVKQSLTHIPEPFIVHVCMLGTIPHRRGAAKSGGVKHAAGCRSSRPDDLTPPEGEATAPDFEKNLEKDPHEADIPDFAGLNVKSQVCSRT